MYPTITNKTFKSDNKQAIPGTWWDEYPWHDNVINSGQVTEPKSEGYYNRLSIYEKSTMVTWTDKSMKDGFQLIFDDNRHDIWSI